MTSSTSSRARLERVYRRTAYHVIDGEQSFALTIGVREGRLDALLARHHARFGVLITAYNPDSQPLDDRTNRRRQAAFERSIATPYLPAWGEGLVGNWKPEVGVLLLGITPHRAKRLGARWEQVAVVIGIRGGRPRLLWCRTENFAR